jgi:tRNA pseudouridine38-40 synthase
VEGEVERALEVLLRAAPRSVPLTVAGRTDAGVHAWGQVASYPGSVAPVRGLNALLPDDVAVLRCSEAPDGFDARRDATSRAYCYRILTRSPPSPFLRGRALHWPSWIDVSRLDECARALVGLHDFTAFTPTETEHVHFQREVFGAYWRSLEGGLLEFWIEADAFMRHMNRVLVGTMLEVAGGRRTVDSFAGLLAGAPRSEAGRTAPAHGLYLAGVGYGSERVLGRLSGPGGGRRDY